MRRHFFAKILQKVITRDGRPGRVGFILFGIAESMFGDGVTFLQSVHMDRLSGILDLEGKMYAEGKMEQTRWCKKNLLARGWSEQAIRELLPDPVVKRNPRYPDGPPMRLWNAKDVLEAEQSERFLLAAFRRALREEEAARRAENSMAALRAAVANCCVTVRRMGLGELRENAVRSVEEYRAKAGGTGARRVRCNPDRYTAERWMVNYARHCLVEFGDSGRVMRLAGKRRGAALLRNLALDKIAETWPELAAECRRQKAAVDFRIDRPQAAG